MYQYLRYTLPDSENNYKQNQLTATQFYQIIRLLLPSNKLKLAYETVISCPKLSVKEKGRLIKIIAEPILCYGLSTIVQGVFNAKSPKGLLNTPRRLILALHSRRAKICEELTRRIFRIPSLRNFNVENVFPAHTLKFILSHKIPKKS